MFAASSGVACTSTGTSSRANRNVSAIARSSPKFGSETITPSSRSRFFWNNAAQRLASSCVSTAPCLLCSGLMTTQSTPALASARMISSRPVFASWSGKKPRLPTMTPIVIFLMPIPSLPEKHFCLMPTRRRVVPAVKGANQGQQPSPPGAGVKLKQHHLSLRRRRVRDLVQTRAQNEHSIHQQRQADEKPDRNRTSCCHKDRLPEDYVQNHKHSRRHSCPENRLLIQRNVFNRRNCGLPVHQALQCAIRYGLGRQADHNRHHDAY